MNRREAIRDAWENWHSDVDPDENPLFDIAFKALFDIAFNAGFDAAADEVRSVLTLLDGLAEQWGDEAVFRRCRDRLRAVTNA
jgi:hypothetical protein